MKLLHGLQISSCLLFCVSFVVVAAPGQRDPNLLPEDGVVSGGVPATGSGTARAFPCLHLAHGLDVTYVGEFSPEALYRATTPPCAGGRGRARDEAGRDPDGNTDGLPPSMVVPVERVVEDPEPPVHAQSAAAAHSTTVKVRNHFLTYAYGHPKVLRGPSHVATDSQHRLVVSDPGGGALHVLDPRGKTSFRIPCGPNWRLREPAGVAVDADDNIYVADSQRGYILMFDSGGNFVRLMGDFHGEPEFAGPHGLAIDLAAKRLYVSDTPRSVVAILDLEGRILRQLGLRHEGPGEGWFENPTDIAVSHGHLYVVDRRGSRVQIIDPDKGPIRNVGLSGGLDMNGAADNGLGVDTSGAIYVSWTNNGHIWVFSDDGLPLASFGQKGTGLGEFIAPGGLWLDGDDRLYVADAASHRVQMFQIKQEH
jgi:DNA-binding beta-propeller fold protein YncE